MAAVPLMQGDRMVGALLLEERHTAPATAPVTSETHTSVSILSTGLGPSNTHVPVSGPRALAATLGNSTLSVFVAASGATAAGAATSGHMAPSPAAALLRDTDMLRSLSFTASMCLVGRLSAAWAREQLADACLLARGRGVDTVWLLCTGIRGQACI